jgi:hypothetical protein
MQIGPWAFRVNAGMAAAGVLLVAGGALFLAAPEENRLARNAGLGIVVLSSVVYLAARIAMVVRERRR